MKRTISLLLILSFGMWVHAQHVKLTYRTHGLTESSVNEMKTASHVDPGSGGSHCLWDLSGMELKKDFLGTIDAANGFYEAPGFPKANIVLTEGCNRFLFRQENNELLAYGMASSNGSLQIHYDQPYVKMKYPFAYGDEISGAYEGTYLRSEKASPLSGTFSVKADGYGKLILPGGTEIADALRVVSTRSFTIMIGDNPQSFEMITYRWYNQQERFPLAVIHETYNSACADGKGSFKAAYKVISPEKQQAFESIPVTHDPVKVYPNPIKNEFNLEYVVPEDGHVLLTLSDSKGQIITHLVDRDMESGSYSDRFNADLYSLQPGVYFIIGKIGTGSSTASFIKQK